MSTAKPQRPKARLPRGFRDRTADEIAAERKALDSIRKVYESYGFEPLETPAFEFTDALGKFLPDVDRPNEGVFSLKDDDEQWLSLRYDLTAPLARYVAEHFQDLPKPFRRYAVGSVWRNEKPGPGRYREFTQFDADTVGSNSPAADAELLMMVCDALEALGLTSPSDFCVFVSSRKLLDGVLESAGLLSADAARRGIVLRAIDKLDRLGLDGVKALLGSGRKDESGDFTPGANLSPEQIDQICGFLMNEPHIPLGIKIGEDKSIRPNFPADYNFQILEKLEPIVGGSISGRSGLDELKQIASILRSAGYGPEKIRMNTSVVRGLDYYTGAVFEAVLNYVVTSGSEIVSAGSIAGGGRYDDLVARFTGQSVPATGISIGVSRLMGALRLKGLTGDVKPLILVLSLDDAPRAFATARELRGAGFRAETYTGTKKFGDQLKYADKRGAVLAVIEGGDEVANKQVTIKNLAAGTELSKAIESRAEYLGARQAQETVARTDLVATVRKMLGGGG